ncbi:hypothetical protein ACWCP6_15495 [Streptomyces sp. NPDC002004]
MTEKLLQPLSARPLPERWLVRLLGAALASGAYLLFLPWDLRNRPRSPGAVEETTPVTGVGVALLAASLLILAVHFGCRDRLWWSPLLVGVPPAALMYVSFRTHPEPDAAVWPLAWAFFSVLILLGVLVVAAVASRFRADLAYEPTLTRHR